MTIIFEACLSYRIQTTQLIWLVILSIGMSASVFAQPNIGGVPFSYQNTLSDIKKVPVKPLPVLNIDSIQAAAATHNATSKQRGRAARANGKAVKVPYNLLTDGVCDQLDNGDCVWRLGIDAQQYERITFHFEDFYLPEGATLYVYNKESGAQIGGYTHQNNKASGRFSTHPIQGGIVYLEYYEPQTVAKEGNMNILMIGCHFK